MSVVGIPFQITPSQGIGAFGDDFESDASQDDEQKRLADLLCLDRVPNVVKCSEGLVDSLEQIFDVSRKNGIFDFLPAGTADSFLFKQHSGLTYSTA